MKLIELKCKNCGSNLEVSEDTKNIKCKYCGAEYKLDDEVTHIKYDNAREAGYEFEMGRQEALTPKGPLKYFIFIPAIFIFVIAMIIMFNIINTGSKIRSKESLNPFDYIKVSFEGKSGSGKVKTEIIDNEKSISLSDFSFKWSKAINLTEGETITLNISSNKYRLTKTKNTYTVEGLETYLNNLDIPSQNLNTIHANTKITLYKIPYKMDEIKNQTNIKMYLSTNNKDKNTLYDVVKVTLKDNKVYYLVVYYKNIIIRENASIDFDTSMYMGSNVSGTLIGYKSLEDVKADILTKQAKDMKLLEKDL